MKLYGYYRSSAVFRCRIAFHLLGLGFEPHYIDLSKGDHLSADYAKLSPQKLVPALEDKGKIITQSLAIIEYVNEMAGGHLIGVNPQMRALSRAFALTIACEIHPLQNLRVQQYLFDNYGDYDPDIKQSWLNKWMGDGLAACEAMVKSYGYEGKFTLGEQTSLADIYLVPQMASAQRFGVDTTPYPLLNQINEYAMTHDAFIKAAPANQPDAPK